VLRASEFFVNSSQDKLRIRIHGAIAVVIPAYNEAEALPAVLDAMPATVAGLAVVTLVVDDGSADGTAEAAEAHGAIAIRHEHNRGGGAALRTGFAVAIDAGARIVVTLDADGQHLPSEMGALVEPVAAGRAGLAVGSRVLGAADPNTRARELGIAVFNRLVSFLMWHRVTDSSNGYRAIDAAVLAQLDLRQEQFHTSELLIEALARGVEVIEVPVTVAARTHGTTRKPRSLRYGFGFARAIAGTWIRTLPLRLARRRAS
jgi:glycosyltransferase involved in cell wall biosynthesis